MNRCPLGCGSDCPVLCPCECHLGREGDIAATLVRVDEPRLPAPKDVIKAPRAELAITEVAPPEVRKPIVDELAAPAKVVGVDLPDPFDDPTIPTELRRKHDRH